MLSIDNNYLQSILVQALPTNTKFQRLAGKNKLILSANIGESIDVGDGDFVKRALTIHNVNDGAHALRFNIGLFRLICSNGLQVPSALGFEAKIIHRECAPTFGFIKHFNELVEQAIDNSNYAIDIIGELKDIKLTEAKGIDIIGNLNISYKAKYNTMKYWLSPEKRRPNEQKLNAWTLVNITNEVIRACHGKSFEAVKQNKTLVEDVILLTA